MNKRLIAKTRARLLPLAAGAALAIAGVTSAALPAIASAATVPPGEVVKLSGTPNLWVVDSQGVAHFASDPQALAGKPVNWGSQVELTADQLAGVTRGTPWLSMALVQIGDSIYLAEPGTGASSASTSAASTDAMSSGMTTGIASGPVLLHVPSPYDLWLLGVTPENYGQLVLDRPTWEKQYGVSLDKATIAGDFQLTPAPYVPDSSEDESGS
jgi:hypothetical protein